MNFFYSKKSTDKLLNIIIGTASILLVIHVALIFFKESGPILAEIPMFIPMFYAFGALAAVCIIVLSLGRQRVLNDAVSYWTGIAFLNILITNIFYILSWPGLLASGLPIIGNNTNTAAWILIYENISISIIFFVASFISWPGKTALKGNRWTISIAGWTFAAVLINILIIASQDYLPLLVINDQFTILSKTTVVLLILIMFSATILMIRRYRHTKSQMTGYVALLMVLLEFTYIEQLLSVNRYALLWYTGRIIGVLSFVVLLFGLLREYVNLYKREQEKSRGLIESERKTNEILNAITDSSFLIDKNWIITQINDKALEFFRMKREDIIGKLYWDVFPVTIGTFIEDNFRKAVTQNITFSFEMHSMVKEAWTEMHLYPSDNGLTVRFRDISERKQMEVALHESEKKYRELVKFAPTTICEIDFRTKKFTAVNEAMVMLSGYSKEELLNMNVLDLLDDEGKISFQSRIAGMFNGDKPDENVEYKVKAKDGRIIYALLNTKFILDEKRIPIGAMCVGHDITSRRKSEEALQESEERYRGIVETANEGIITAWDGLITFVNKKMADMLGYTVDELIGKNGIELIHPDEIDLSKERINSRKSGETESYDIRFKHRNGDIIWMHVNGAPILDAKGLHIGNLGMYTDITKQKLAEEALRISERKFSMVQENMSEGLMLFDKEGNVIHQNPASFRIHGFHQDDAGQIENRELPVIWRGWDEQGQLLSFEEWPLSRVIRGDHVQDLILRAQRNDTGHEFFASYNGSPVFDNKGEITFGFITIRDITERKRIEEELKKSNETYMELVTNARSMIFKMDTNGIFTFVNEFALNFFGYKENELVGKSPTETITPHRESSGRNLDLLIEKIYVDPDKFGVNINENIKKNGERVWVEWHNKALFDKNGKRTGHIAIGIDITDRINAQGKLKEAQDKLNVALENGSIGIWEWNLKTDEVVWDERMETMFGLESGTFGNTYEAFESLVNDEDLSHFRNAIKQTLEKNLPFETIFRTKSLNNKTKYISTKALINKDKDGKPVSFAGVCFDVTGLKEGTERLISKLNEELLRSNKELERFAYVASHDLQEPLRMVTSYTQLLARHYNDKLDARALEYINFAVDGSKRMYDLLNGLLAYSRIHTKGKSFSTVNINRVLESVKKNISMIIKERNATIIADDLPVIFADESQMVQLFQNLISNAIKFNVNSPRICISLKSEADKYVISVKDNGIGIEPQYFDKIFQIFQRLHVKEQYEGTGIGLAICKRIVERHGGRIWVESEFGTGSVFLFAIPKEVN